MAVLLSVLSMMFTLLSPLERDESYFCTATEPISAHSRESGNPGAENSAKDWVPASAGTNGIQRRFKLSSSRSGRFPGSSRTDSLKLYAETKRRHSDVPTRRARPRSSAGASGRSVLGPQGSRRLVDPERGIFRG